LISPEVVLIGFDPVEYEGALDALRANGGRERPRRG
jgi:hypothetical protein